MIINIWPDGVWCFKEDLEEMMSSPCAKSDDHKPVSVPGSITEAGIENVVNNICGIPSPKLLARARDEELHALFDEVRCLERVGCTGMVRMVDVLALIQRRSATLQQRGK